MAQPGSPAEDGAHGEVKPFLLKAYALVDDPATDSIISWTPSGEHFVVHNPEAFANQVLPNNFKHNNFSSFIRQLNTYGFRKVETDKWSFGHDCFKRGKQHLLGQIQRKRGGTSGRARPASSGAAGGVAGDAAEPEGDDDLDIFDPSLTALMPLGTPALGVSPVAAGSARKGAVSGGRRVGAGGAQQATPSGASVPSATQVLAELVRMSQQQAEMLAEVKQLQADLQQTRESQHLTRATIGKVVGFLQHMHGHQGQPADGGVYLQGPGLDSPLPPAKRTRLQLTNSTRDIVTVRNDPPAAPEVAVTPAGPHAQHAPIFKPETLAISRQISRQLSKTADDEVASIDIDSVLELLNGIEKELPESVVLPASDDEGEAGGGASLTDLLLPAEQPLEVPHKPVSSRAA